MELFDFGVAIEKLKSGARLARKNWDSQCTFIYYIPENSYPPSTEAAQNYFGNHVPYEAYIAMKTSDDKVVPWSASQTDILADDYYIVGD